jgi:type IV pilus assembly protein PilV
MMKILGRGAHKGFTLLELLVAVSLIAVGLLAVASMQGIAANSNSISNRIFVANWLAQQVMEEFLQKKETDGMLNTPTTPGVFEPYLFPPTGDQSVTILHAGTYAATYSVLPNPPGASGTTLITVRIHLINKSGTIKTTIRDLADPSRENVAAIVTAYKRISS